MSADLYREDDLLADFGPFLQTYGFTVLALSGNQQGRYWFKMGEYRKGPDIVAVRGNMILVGEAKVRSRGLFQSTRHGWSDYQSLQFLIDTPSAYQQLSDMVSDSMEYLGKPFSGTPQIQAVVVGGDSFLSLKSRLTDTRIWHITAGRESEGVEYSGFFDGHDI